MQSGLPRHRGRVEKQAVTGMGKRAPGQRKYLYMYAADVMAGLKSGLPDYVGKCMQSPAKRKGSAGDFVGSCLRGNA